MATGSAEDDLLPFTNYTSTLNQSFFHMFRNNKLTDATLICEGHHIPVHKFLLSSSSSFFNKMFKNPTNMIEDSLPIKNVKYSDLMNVLEYIYSGNVKVQSNKLNSFIDAAKKLSITIDRNHIQNRPPINVHPNEQNGRKRGENSSGSSSSSSTERGDGKSQQIKKIQIVKSIDDDIGLSASLSEPVGVLVVSQKEFLERMFKARGLSWPYDVSNQNMHRTAQQVHGGDDSASKQSESSGTSISATKNAQSNSVNVVSQPTQSVVRKPHTEQQSSSNVDKNSLISRIELAMAQTNEIRDLNDKIANRTNKMSKDELDALKSQLKEILKKRVKFGREELKLFKAEKQAQIQQEVHHKGEAASREIVSPATSISATKSTNKQAQSNSADILSQPLQSGKGKPLLGHQSSSIINQTNLMSRVELALDQTSKIREINDQIANRKKLLSKNELDELKCRLKELLENRVQIKPHEMKLYISERQAQMPGSVQTQKDVNLMSLEDIKAEISVIEWEIGLHGRRSPEKKRLKSRLSVLLDKKQKKDQKHVIKSAPTQQNEASNSATTSLHSEVKDPKANTLNLLIVKFGQTTDDREKRRVIKSISELCQKIEISGAIKPSCTQNSQTMVSPIKTGAGDETNQTIQEINETLRKLKLKLESISKQIAIKQKSKNIDELKEKFIEILMQRNEVKKKQDEWENSIDRTKKK